MKLPEDPRLPAFAGATGYDRQLYTRLYELFRSIARQVNGTAEGRIVAYYNAATAPPTTGQHAQGDFIRNLEPTDLGGYMVIGWLCVASGEPGTWKEARCQTI